MTFLLIFFIALLVTIFLTPYTIQILEKNGITDKPGKRKIHNDIKPRMGGIVIFVVVFTLLFLFYPNISSIRFFLLGMMAISICGAIDDILGLKWNTKIFFQCIAVIFLMLHLYNDFANITFLGYDLPYIIGIPIIFLLLLGTINAVNLMDGLDGLVTSYSLLTLIVLLLLSININNFFMSVILSAFVGSLLGYLNFNGFPARIFLGDLGSLFLGYVLIGISSEISIKYYNTMELSFPIILLSLPIIDTLKVFMLRIINKKNPFLPDNEHLHHIIYNNFGHKSTVFLMLLFNIFFITISLVYLIKGNNIVLIFYILFVLMILFAKNILEKLKHLKKLKHYFYLLSKIPAKVFEITYKYFVPVTSIFVVSIIIILFPQKPMFSTNNLLILIIPGVTLLSVTIFHRKYNHQLITNIYFFFNLVMYLIFCSYPNSLFDFPQTFKNSFNITFWIIIFSVIIIFIGMFIISRRRILPKDKIFLSGIDLTTIVLVISTFLLEREFPNLILGNLTEIFFVAFMLYIWFKIIYMFNKKYANILFITSFIVPITKIFYLLVI